MSGEDRTKTYKTALGPVDGQSFTVFMWHNKSSWIMRCDSDTPGDAADVVWDRFYDALNTGNWHAWVTLRGARNQFELAAKAIGAAVPEWSEHLQEA